MDAAISTSAENKDYVMNINKLPLQRLQRQRQLEAKREDLESRARGKNLRIYAVPEPCEGNILIEFVARLIREKLDVVDELNIERSH